MTSNLLRFPAKKLRAEAIRRYTAEAGYEGVVCFSCGNAACALGETGLRVVSVSPAGDLEARRWWSAAEIRRVWPHLFDATSGHLPGPVMAEVAGLFREHLGPLEGKDYEVPTGSGETLVCLAMAYPEKRFRPVYGLDQATRYEPRAPLNALVAALARSEEDR